MAARKEGRPTKKWRWVCLDRLKHRVSLEKDLQPRCDPEAAEDPWPGTEVSAWLMSMEQKGTDVPGLPPLSKLLLAQRRLLGNKLSPD